MRAIFFCIAISISHLLTAQSLDTVMSMPKTKQSLGITLGVPRYNFSKINPDSHLAITEESYSPQVSLFYQRNICKRFSARIGMAVYYGTGTVNYSYLQEMYDYSYIISSIQLSTLYNYYESDKFSLYAKIQIVGNFFWSETYNLVNIQASTVSYNFDPFFEYQNPVIVQCVPLGLTFNATKNCDVIAEIAPKYVSSYKYNRFSTYRIGVSFRL